MMFNLCYAKQTIPTTKVDYMPVDFVTNANEVRSSIWILDRYRKNLTRIDYVKATLDDFLAPKAMMSVEKLFSGIAVI